MTARKGVGKVLGRATPTIYNSAYNTIHMWDGRKASLEDQATGPLESPDEMAANFDEIQPFGVSCRFVTLEKLIQLKHAAGRAKNLEIVAELQALLEVRRKRDSSS